jgi:hypothetical protein
LHQFALAVGGELALEDGILHALQAVIEADVGDLGPQLVAGMS